MIFKMKYVISFVLSCIPYNKKSLHCKIINEIFKIFRKQKNCDI